MLGLDKHEWSYAAMVLLVLVTLEYLAVAFIMDHIDYHNWGLDIGGRVGIVVGIIIDILISIGLAEKYA